MVLALERLMATITGRPVNGVPTATGQRYCHAAQCHLHDMTVSYGDTAHMQQHLHFGHRVAFIHDLCPRCSCLHAVHPCDTGVIFDVLEAMLQVGYVWDTEHGLGHTCLHMNVSHLLMKAELAPHVGVRSGCSRNSLSMGLTL